MVTEIKDVDVTTDCQDSEDDVGEDHYGVWQYR
jgi:hypothetical protein